MYSRSVTYSFAITVNTKFQNEQPHHVFFLSLSILIYAFKTVDMLKYKLLVIWVQNFVRCKTASQSATTNRCEFNAKLPEYLCINYAKQKRGFWQRFAGKNRSSCPIFWIKKPESLRWRLITARLMSCRQFHNPEETHRQTTAAEMIADFLADQGSSTTAKLNTTTSESTHVIRKS